MGVCLMRFTEDGLLGNIILIVSHMITYQKKSITVHTAFDINLCFIGYKAGSQNSLDRGTRLLSSASFQHAVPISRGMVNTL